MIYSSERGSVIDAIETKVEESLKELERCKDWRYFYINYHRIINMNGDMIRPKYNHLLETIARNVRQ